MAAAATRGAPPAFGKTSLPPNQTLYVANIPSTKMQKADLRISLYTLFSTYGPVIDVVALKTDKMKGRAHVVYRDIQTATQAMRALQGFEFFGREIVIQYAKTKSDAIAKLDGTYRMPSAATEAALGTEIQQSIFNNPPTASSSSAPTGGLKPPPSAVDQPMEDAKSPTPSVAGQKRRREEEDDSDEDVAMEEDSDDD